jgi:hypothetical protein
MAAPPPPPAQPAQQGGGARSAHLEGSLHVLGDALGISGQGDAHASISSTITRCLACPACQPALESRANPGRALPAVAHPPLSQVPVCVAKYAGSGELAQRVEAAVRVTQDSNEAVAAAVAAAGVLERVVLVRAALRCAMLCCVALRCAARAVPPLAAQPGRRPRGVRGACGTRPSAPA